MADNPVLSLDDAKGWLRIQGDELDDQTLLPAIINAAVRAVERKVGPIVPVTVTERVCGSGSGFVLSRLPVLSVTSITGVGGTFSVDNLDVQARSGLVQPQVGTYGWLPSGDCSVVYQAGRAAPFDPDLIYAVKEMVRYLAGSYRRGRSPRQQGEQPATMALPPAITMLLQPLMPGGFA